MPPGSETLRGARGGRLAGFEPKSSFLRGLPYREPEVWGGRGEMGRGARCAAAPGLSSPVGGRIWGFCALPGEF